MFSHLLPFLTPVILAVATVLHTLLQTRIITPQDHDRAALLEQLAKGAAAVVVALYPNADWATLLEAVVNAISGAASVPTRNRDAIQRAAAAALAELVPNKLPPAKTA